MATTNTKLYFRVDDVCCNGEVTTLKSLLSPLLNGREDFIQFDLKSKKLTVEIPSSIILSEKQIIQAIDDVAMTAIPWIEQQLDDIKTHQSTPTTTTPSPTTTTTTTKLYFKVDDVTCPTTLKGVLRPLLNNREDLVHFDLKNKKLTVEIPYPLVVTEKQIVQEIDDVAMTAIPWEEPYVIDTKIQSTTINEINTTITKLEFKVEDVCCNGEITTLKSLLSPLLNGREDLIQFDLKNKKLTVEIPPSIVLTETQIIQAIDDVAMTAIPWISPSCSSCSSPCSACFSPASSENIEIKMITKLHFKVDDVCCKGEITTLKSVLSPLLNGREDLIIFDLENKKLTLEIPHPLVVTEKQIIQAIDDVAMTALPWKERLETISNEQSSYSSKEQSVACSKQCATVSTNEQSSCSTNGQSGACSKKCTTTPTNEQSSCSSKEQSGACSKKCTTIPTNGQSSACSKKCTTIPTNEQSSCSSKEQSGACSKKCTTIPTTGQSSCSTNGQSGACSKKCTTIPTNESSSCSSKEQSGACSKKCTTISTNEQSSCSTNEQISSCAKKCTIPTNGQSGCCSKKSTAIPLEELFDTKTQSTEIEMIATGKLHFKVDKVCCNNEVKTLKGALGPLLNGREDLISVDLKVKKLTVEIPHSFGITEKQILQAIDNVAMTAIPWDERVDTKSQPSKGLTTALEHQIDMVSAKDEKRPKGKKKFFSRLQESKEDQDTEGNLILKVQGVCCGEEVAMLKRALSPLMEGREDLIRFDLINEKMTIERPSNVPTASQVIKIIEEAGMSAILWQNHVKSGDSEKKEGFTQKYGRLISASFSVFFAALGFGYHAGTESAAAAFAGGEKGGTTPVISMAFYLACIVAGGVYVLPNALRALRRFRANEYLLMSIAVIGAIAVNQWFEGAVVAFLFSSSLVLEKWNVARARKAIRGLMELAPSTARVVETSPLEGRDTKPVEAETMLPIESVQVGAIIVVNPGEKIPMDSTLISGLTDVNQAPITGESLPVRKNVGDELFAGTINGDHVIRCRVTKAASDSTLARIIRMVEDAQSRRSRSEQIAEKFARYYTPVMIFIALVIAVVIPLSLKAPFEPWIYEALTILVISCPCALVISTPLTITAGLSAAARAGVLIKGGAYLEAPAHLKVFAMDKTGTLTKGEPAVQTIISFNGYNKRQVLALGVILETHSDHPLARAIRRAGKLTNVEVNEKIENFLIVKGKGAEGTINGKPYWVGSYRFLTEKMIDGVVPLEIQNQVQHMESRGHSVVAIGSNQETYGLISIADTIRSESKRAMQALKDLGIQKIVMLTGDNNGTARAIAEMAGVTDYFAELLPADKVTRVEGLVKEYKNAVAMVGDGINDAPAIAASNLGIAMGAAGSDAAIETADIALMSDNLDKLPWLVRHARRTSNIIKQNITFSLAIKALFTGLAFAGRASLWMAILADMGSSFLVIFNGLRLLNNQPVFCKPKQAKSEMVSMKGTINPEEMLLLSLLENKSSGIDSPTASGDTAIDIDLADSPEVKFHYSSQFQLISSKNDKVPLIMGSKKDCCIHPSDILMQNLPKPPCCGSPCCELKRCYCCET